MHTKATVLTLIALTLFLSACTLAYRPDVNQGNYLTTETIAQLEVGMTREQVTYLLGSPMAGNPFRRDRWDYVYFLDSKRSENKNSYLVVWFENDMVSRFETRIPPKD